MKRLTEGLSVQSNEMLIQFNNRGKFIGFDYDTVINCLMSYFDDITIEEVEAFYEELNYRLKGLDILQVIKDLDI